MSQDPSHQTTVTMAHSTAPHFTATEVQVPRQVESVRLVREIGRGAMGVVWLGHDVMLNRDVAVKFLLNVVSGPDDPGFGRLLQGSRAAAALRHPGLVMLHHAGLVACAASGASVPYFVMEYVDGPTVADVLKGRGPLSLAEVLAVLDGVCSALAALHDRGIVHRDVKPQNLMLAAGGPAGAGGRVYVTDFGLACGRTPAGAQPGSVLFAGTPSYMPPEAFDGAATPRGDIYALGVTAYQLLTGAAPFKADSWQELREKHRSDPLPLEPLAAHGLGEAVADVLGRAVHKSAMFRYKTAGAFLRALHEAAGPKALPRRPETELAALVARHRGEPVPAEPAAAAAADGAKGGGVKADAVPGSSYRERLSQLAEAKRRSRGSPQWGDGGPGGQPPAPNG